MAATRWYKYPLRVRYQETDQMGVVYHANYLNWFEIGRTEFIREAGMTYRLLEEKGLLLPVIEAEVKFRMPARYDDTVMIYTRVVQFSSIKIQFESQIRRWEENPEYEQMLNSDCAGVEPEGELLVHGTTNHIWLNRSWKPVRIDKEAPELIILLKSVQKVN
jgi:acyl-CoA thioester hydrolase